MSDTSGSSWKVKTQLSGTANYEIFLDDLEILWEEKNLLDQFLMIAPVELSVVAYLALT
jgi:hypothetical protein